MPHDLFFPPRVTASSVQGDVGVRSVPLACHGRPAVPGVWSLGKPLVGFHTDEGILQDSVLNAKEGQLASKSNYLRSSAALDVSPVDCSNNPLLESGSVSA